MAVNNGTSQNALALLAQQSLGQMPAAIRNALGGKIVDELGSGISSGFAIVSIRGKAFRVKHRGEERIIMRSDNDGPKSSIDVVIVQSSPAIAKIYYQSGYVEGSTAPPDCWSVDGIKPDLGAPKRQSETCVGCPQNAWGSAVRPGGTSKGKACADSKRIAIVPVEDMRNELYGGPMLMRIPPASLAAVKAYADALKAINYVPHAVVTRISFDPTTEYPALVFNPVRALTEEEAVEIMGMRDTPLMDRVLNTALDHVETDGQDKSHVAPLPVQSRDTAAPAPAMPPFPGVNLPPHDPETGEISPAPATPNPVQASVQRAAEVEQKVTGDPKAAQRVALRAAGLTEEQIDAAIGPEPKAPEPENPQIAALRAAGLNDEQIARALGVTLPGNEPAKPKQTRQRKPKEEPKQEELKKETPPVDTAPQPQETPPAPTQEEAALGALPEDFEAALNAMLPPANQ